jgi:hypothetical protein
MQRTAASTRADRGRLASGAVVVRSTGTSNHDKALAPLVWVILALALLSSPSWAQPSASELSKEAANPLADLISLPFQNNTDFGLGEFDRSRNILNIQPVIPVAKGKIITRTILPVAWLPDLGAESGSLSTGLADTLLTAFYAVPAGSLTVGVGPAFEIPTGGPMRGSKKWSLGPSAVALAQPGPWTLGILVNNVWSFAGDSDRADVNKGLLQYFIVRQLGSGWYVNSAPSITVNWKAEPGQKWTVPFGVGFGKVAFLGKLPVNTQVGAFVNAVKPDLGADWQLRVQFQVLLPTSLFGGKKEGGD